MVSAWVHRAGGRGLKGVASKEGWQFRVCRVGVFQGWGRGPPYASVWAGPRWDSCARRAYMPRRIPLVSKLVRLPLRSCSSSKALNSELKLPAPKPWSGREKKVSCGPRESQPCYPAWPRGLVGDSWYLVIVALDDFQEERGPILHGLGEDLQ